MMLLLLAGVAAGLMSCHRRAPGPHECLTLARAVLGIPEGVRRLPPEIDEQVAAITQRCITWPYDRQLLQCVGEGRMLKTCEIRMALRRGEGQPPEL